MARPLYVPVLVWVCLAPGPTALPTDYDFLYFSWPVKSFHGISRELLFHGSQSGCERVGEAKKEGRGIEERSINKGSREGDVYPLWFMKLPRLDGTRSWGSRDT